MSDLQQLKKKLLRGAVSDNVDLMAHRHPRRGRLPGMRQSVGTLLFLAAAGVLALPYLGSALTPTLVERHAAWVYLLPGTDAMRGLLVAERSLNATGAVSAPTPAAAGEPADVITVSAADTLEELDLRFEQPPILVDREILDLTLRRVIIDPGHGGRQIGTSSGPLVEKEITLDIAKKLRPLLEEQGFEVFLTREDDRDVPHEERVRFANQNRGDVFLSIHINWFGERDLRGVETFYLGPTIDPELRDLVAKENRGSGYSLTEFRKLLDGIYVDLRREESMSFARHVHRSIYGKLRVRVPTMRNRGIKQAPFVVLVGTEMPAVLAEVSCLSNADEARLLSTDGYRATIAEALAEGISGYADSLRPEPPARAAASSTDDGPAGP